MNDLFWFQDPKIIFRKDKILEVWPYESMTFYEKLNATTRFIILISLLGFMLLNNYLILLFGVLLIGCILFIYKYQNDKYKENLENRMVEASNEDKYTYKNPLYNVMLTDYEDDVNKKELKKPYNSVNEELINKNAKNFVLENNKDNKEIGNLFKSMANNLDFEKSMRQFHINPSTTIPNNQDDFLEFCYNKLYSEKPLLVY